MAKLLIVDDEKNIRLNLAALFQEYQVQTAASGQEAMEALAADDFDLVLTDYRMAEMTGWSCCEKSSAGSLYTKVITHDRLRDGAERGSHYESWGRRLSDEAIFNY